MTQKICASFVLSHVNLVFPLSLGLCSRGGKSKEQKTKHEIFSAVFIALRFLLFSALSLLLFLDYRPVQRSCAQKFQIHRYREHPPTIMESDQHPLSLSVCLSLSLSLSLPVVFCFRVF